MEESINQIKTALDDWIVTIKDYNTYRNSFWPNITGLIIAGRFLNDVEYYELDVSSLNPEEKE